MTHISDWGANYRTVGSQTVLEISLFAVVYDHYNCRSELWIRRQEYNVNGSDGTLGVEGTLLEFGLCLCFGLIAHLFVGDGLNQLRSFYWMV